MRQDLTRNIKAITVSHIDTLRKVVKEMLVFRGFPIFAFSLKCCLLQNRYYFLKIGFHNKNTFQVFILFAINLPMTDDTSIYLQ